MNKYYIAFAYKSKIQIGFGDTIITSKNKLKMNTIEDIENIKSFILEKMKEKDNTIKGITIMDFRGLEE